MEAEKKELLERIKKLAAAYTPEWKFDEERPDIATALACLWVDMFYGTVRRSHRLMEKNQVEFFKTVGTRLRPSVPAEGYVVFEMASDEFGGVEIPKGLLVAAESKEETPEVSFETQEAVYATPVRLQEIFLADGKEDRFWQIYNSEKEEEASAEIPPFYLFQPVGNDLQEHVFFFGHEQVLYLSGPAKVYLQLRNRRFSEAADAIPDWMLKKEITVFEYFSEIGFISFGGRHMEGKELVLELRAGQLPPVKTVWKERETYVIRCRLLRPFVRSDFSIEGFRLRSAMDHVFPDTVQTEQGEENARNVYPFGERPAPYGEVYIAADQVFSKAGAKVVLNFRVDYERVPLEDVQESERDWKLVMRRENFIPDPEYDVTIERVSWEYFNGSGWSRLFSGQEYSRIFNGGDGSMGQQFSLEFTCPQDMQPFLYDSVQSRYIRIRILKMNNLFKQKGNYITPIIRDLHFSFSYMGQGKTPGFLEACNTKMCDKIAVWEQDYRPVLWTLFWGLKEQERALYMKFSGPLTEGPVKILFAMAETLRTELPRLEFAYYGGGAFRPLPVMDETDNLRKSGVWTFMGRPDFEKAVLFGSEGYWLRVTDAKGEYQKRSFYAKNPLINGIYMNAAKVLAVQTMPDEYFSIESGEKNKVCTLLNQKVYSLEVWVDESGTLTENQKRRIAAELETQEERDTQGDISRFWVKWTEVEDFCLSGPEDRHYMADKSQGTVMFADGKNGAVPSGGSQDTIRIHYTCGGGENGNQQVGQISQMTQTLGYINRVYNPLVTTGGSDQETAKEAMERCVGWLRHRGKAVTASDYESLAMAASRSVLKVRCFPNCRGDGSREPGSVTLVVLQKDFKTGRMYFERVKQEILHVLGPSLPGNLLDMGRFYVVEPNYLELRCQMELSVSDFNDVFDVKKRVLERMEEFLDPVQGNFNKKGWQIGEVPNEIQITNALKGIPGIRYIREVQRSAFVQSKQGWVEAERDSEEEQRFAVALNGKHQVIITVGE